MTTKFRFLSLLICVSSIQAFGSANDSEFNGRSSAPRHVQQDIRDLMRGIDHVKRVVQERFNRCPADAKAVILLGPTGSGKSTLLHLTAGIPMLSEQDPDGIGYRVDTQNRRYLSEDSTIGHRNVAQTNTPSSWYDQRTNTIYWDCPGFEDTRGHNQKIINAFAIDQLFRATSNVKLALLATEPDLESYRGAGFLKLLHEVTDTFPNHPELKNNISVILSKQQYAHNFPLFLRNRILTITQQEQSHLTPVVRDLLSHLAVGHPNRIASVPRPVASGRYAPDMGPVRAAINSTNFAQRLNPVLHLPEDTNNYIDEAFNVLNGSIVSYMREQGRAHIINYCKNRIRTHRSTVGELRSHFTGLIDTLKNFRNTYINLQDPKSFTRGLNSVFGESFDTQELNDTINLMEFLRNIRHSHSNKDPFNVLQWNDTLACEEPGYPIRYIKELTKVPEVSEQIGLPAINLRGILIGTTDIANELRRAAEANRPVKRIDVFALNTLFLDQDVQKLGCSLNLIAPYWVVVNGIKTIDIGGIAGQNGVNGVDGAGNDGQPGRPGGNAGDFYGKGNTFVGIEQLKVRVSGGAGGKGGNGGRGANGVNGANGDSYKVVDHHRHGNDHCEKSISNGWIRGISWWEIHDIYFDQGTAGTPGQNGGRGGHGGIGGHAGRVIIDGSNNFENFECSEGANGIHGHSGAGGTGGNNGTTIHRSRKADGAWLTLYDRNPRTGEKRHGNGHWHPVEDIGHITYYPTDAVNCPYNGKAADGQPGQGLNNVGLQEPIGREDTPGLRKIIRQAYQDYANRLVGSQDNYHIIPFIERLKTIGASLNLGEASEERPAPNVDAPQPSVTLVDIANARRNLVHRGGTQRAPSMGRGRASFRAGPPLRAAQPTAKQSGVSVASSSRGNTQDGIAKLIRRFNQQ